MRHNWVRDIADFAKYGLLKRLAGDELLIARELLDRGDIERMAILCPPHLVDQWLGEGTRSFDGRS